MEDPLSQKKQATKPDSKLLYYSGMAFQMVALLGLAVFAGIRLDRWTGWLFPLFTIVLPLAALGIILYQIVKDTGKRK
ncbi:Putative F0F1-ATPase subunit Ca2+/Mg2+ transporter [Chitinophaga costaii]|uniref:Putative F0F1-ATPase subunit Ca2+/Mg2+ transporter n=1 Tax=Chitinophaga costaii TaxID=1335309 RepID=A0A1C4DBL6_9BACT|nr:AtpZ/AtpI family protein [Chitinophaga costaii]PUZ24553.1 ATPase F0F1 [Chitinophaga costaii]SCC28777.1 Putative F0F1-ATPase subunit Ca2+/Mg2+ transporter [Chitinophaga costaii]